MLKGLEQESFRREDNGAMCVFHFIIFCCNTIWFQPQLKQRFLYICYCL